MQLNLYGKYLIFRSSLRFDRNRSAYPKATNSEGSRSTKRLEIFSPKIYFFFARTSFSLHASSKENIEIAINQKNYARSVRNRCAQLYVSRWRIACKWAAILSQWQISNHTRTIVLNDRKSGNNYIPVLNFWRFYGGHECWLTNR